MERTEENNATKDRFAHVGKTFSEMDSEKLQAEIAERSKIIKRKIDALMELHKLSSDWNIGSPTSERLPTRQGKVGRE